MELQGHFQRDRFVMANMRTDDSLFRILGMGMEERSEIDLGNCHRYSLYRQVDNIGFLIFVF